MQSLMNIAIAPKLTPPATSWFAESRAVSPPTECDPVSIAIDSRDFGAAFEKSFHRTVRFLASQGAALDIAEEVAQAAWVRAWELRHQLNHRHLLCPWINSIAKNLLKNRVRAERRFEPLLEAARYGQEDSGTLHLEQLLRMCGDPTKVALISDHYVRGYTAEEIGRHLGLSAAAVRVRLFRVRVGLRALLQSQPASG